MYRSLGLRRLAIQIRQDIRFQFKYGFYFLYLFMTTLYIAVLALLPAAWRAPAASLIILTDPAMLGFFFIGGIWLLEQGEGVHGALAITPLSVGEYLAAKAVSLALVSCLAGLAIAAAAMGPSLRLLALAAGLMIGAAACTVVGLYVATFARSVNHYLLLSLPAEAALMSPPLLRFFGVDHPLLAFWPGSLLLDAIRQGLGQTAFRIWPWLGLAGWLALLAWPARHRLRGQFGANRASLSAEAAGVDQSGAGPAEAIRA